MRGGACGQQNLWAVTEKPFPFGNGFFACEEGIRNESRPRWHYRSRYEQLITFSDRNMKSSASCSEKRTAQLPGICLEAALFAGLKSVTRRLPCAFSLIVDGAGQSKGTCQQESAPQQKIAAVSGAGAGSALDEDDLDGMGFADILKGVGLHRADALSVDFDVGDSIALIRSDGEGLIPTLTDADAAGGGDSTDEMLEYMEDVDHVVYFQRPDTNFESH